MREKIKGKALKNLIEALGGNYSNYICKRGTLTNEWLIGKISIKAVEKGFGVKLSIKAKEVNVTYGVNGKPTYSSICSTRNYGELSGIISYFPLNKLEKSTQ